MNTDKVQQIINKIVEDYRSANGKYARNQHAASKKHIARAQELGILEFIPNMPYGKEIGNTEIQLILQAADDSGTAVMNAYGEGEETSKSELYKAIHEVVVETPEPTDEDEEFPFDTDLDELIDEVSTLADAEWLAEKQAEYDQEMRGMSEADAYELNAVMTAAEVVETYGLSPAAVRLAISRGQIPARKSAGTWLINRSIADKMWSKNIVSWITIFSVTATIALTVQW